MARFHWLALRVYTLEGTLRMNRTLVDVLGVLQKNLKSPGAEVKGEDGESEIEDDDEFDETPRTRHRRYMDAEDMSHVSDPDEWSRLHYGVDEGNPRFQQQLDDMHAALRARLHRLETEWELSWQTIWMLSIAWRCRSLRSTLCCLGHRLKSTCAAFDALRGNLVFEVNTGSLV